MRRRHILSLAYLLALLPTTSLHAQDYYKAYVKMGNGIFVVYFFTASKVNEEESTAKLTFIADDKRQDMDCTYKIARNVTTTDSLTCFLSDKSSPNATIPRYFIFRPSILEGRPVEGTMWTQKNKGPVSKLYFVKKSFK